MEYSISIVGTNLQKLVTLPNSNGWKLAELYQPVWKSSSPSAMGCSSSVCTLEAMHRSRDAHWGSTRKCSAAASHSKACKWLHDRISLILEQTDRKIVRFTKNDVGTVHVLAQDSSNCSSFFCDIFKRKPFFFVQSFGEWKTDLISFCINHCTDYRFVCSVPLHCETNDLRLPWMVLKRSSQYFVNIWKLPATRLRIDNVDWNEQGTEKPSIRELENISNQNWLMIDVPAANKNIHWQLICPWTPWLPRTLERLKEYKCLS